MNYTLRVYQHNIFPLLTSYPNLLHRDSLWTKLTELLTPEHPTLSIIKMPYHCNYCSYNTEENNRSEGNDRQACSTGGLEKLKTLVIGDSITRSIRLKNQPTILHCLPGGRATDVAAKLASIE